MPNTRKRNTSPAKKQITITLHGSYLAPLLFRREDVYYTGFFLEKRVPGLAEDLMTQRLGRSLGTKSAGQTSMEQPERGELPMTWVKCSFSFNNVLCLFYNQ